MLTTHHPAFYKIFAHLTATQKAAARALYQHHVQQARTFAERMGVGEECPLPRRF